MEEIAHEVFRMPGMVPLFLAAVTGAAASLREAVKAMEHDHPMSETTGMKSAREMEASFLKIIDEHHRIIQRICRAYSNTRADQEDLYQEIVYELWTAFPAFKGDSKIGTWLYRVALWSAIQPYRKVHQSPIDFMGILPDHPSDENRIDEGQDDQTRNRLQGLGNFERTVLTLVMEGFSIKEIATAMGLGEESLTRRLRRMKAAIKND